MSTTLALSDVVLILVNAAVLGVNVVGLIRLSRLRKRFMSLHDETIAFRDEVAVFRRAILDAGVQAFMSEHRRLFQRWASIIGDLHVTITCDGDQKEASHDD